MDKRNRVQLEIFDGPLDLLLHLIKNDEISIYDISIERITQQYLDTLSSMQELEIEVAGEFVVMAAHLMYIKSRTLLPPLEQSDEEELEEEDPQWELIRQLLEYKKFKDAAYQLHELAEESHGTFPQFPDASEKPEPSVAPLKEVSTLDLITAFKRALQRFEKQHFIQEIVDEKFTVTDKIQQLITLVTPGSRIFLHSLFAQAGSRTEIITIFLALLELTRLHEFQLSQENSLGEIELTRQKNGKLHSANSASFL